ncbi:uncharacterized protein DUF2730 [Rhizobium subbaraonis]|uniref:Uncharacterized protein DUF2730 n=1 Tax=Rhizobium subbaraonis TaxID=908946 RepID=A0A285UMX8_9HYPH|nr:DUF2730 family protein [Rhizobium subbaraonis]SOC41591.1 uncharacterized protein DUF2730 [Rhizobium subbaraonis]
MSDVTLLRDWLGLIALAISVGTSVTVFFTSGAKKNTATLIDHDRRIQRMEDELRHMPSKDQVTEIKLAMADLKGTVAVLGESMASVSRTVHRLEDFLKERN